MEVKKSNNVNIHFKYEGRINGLVFRTSVEEITIPVIEARLYKKLGLDESKIKMQLSYIVRYNGLEEKSYICDDEDLLLYLTHGDNENRRGVLIVELITTLELPVQQSKTGISSYGGNYENTERIDDESVEIGPNAITFHVDNGGRKEEEEDDDSDSDSDSNFDDDDDDDDNGVESSDRRDYYVEAPLVVECSQSLEAWEDGLDLSIGQEFPSKDDVVDVVHRGAFVKSFGYVIKNSDRNRWVAKCMQKTCTWHVRAVKIPNLDVFSIRTYRNMHTCNRASQSEECSRKRRGSVRLVVATVSEHYPGKLETPTPKEIMSLVKRVVGVDVSYSTALRGKNKAISDVFGSPEENYMMLYRYLYVLEELNEGTKTAVELDAVGKFKYLFIALGACVDGFQFMRKVIMVDATFMKAGFGGVLVFAVAQDPNRHIYPIAFGVLDGENNASWIWFFEKLKTVVEDSSDLVFVSDRNTSLINAVANVYREAHHGFCLWHLAQKVKGNAPSKSWGDVANAFQELGKAHTVAEFNLLYEAFKKRYAAAAKYVEETTVPEKWARCVSPVARYNLDTSNSVESLNKTFRDARKYCLIPMLDTIVRKFSDWFNEHRNESVGGPTANKLVHLVHNFLHVNWPKADKLPVREVNGCNLEYEVMGDDGKPYLVDLISKTCSCRFFDIHRYPCLHALAALICFKKHGSQRDIRIEYYDLCSKYYFVDMWILAYRRSIYVVPEMSAWIVPDYIKEKEIIPPDHIKKKGRRKENRFPSTGERRRRVRTQTGRTQNKSKRGRTLAGLLYGEDFE